MREFWLIAKHEYLIRIRKRSFLISTLGIPAGLALIIALSIFAIRAGIDRRPIGYVDLAGIVAQNQTAIQDKDAIEILPYSQEEGALFDLKAGKIQAYVVIQEDYLTSQALSLYYWDEYPEEALSQFDVFVRNQLLSGYPKDVKNLIEEGPILTIRSADNQKEVSAGAGFINIFLPFLSGLLLFVSVMTSSGFMLQAVADEKENRTIEIMATSIKPEILLTGKAVGLFALSLSQLILWSLTLVVGVYVASNFIEELRLLQFDWSYISIVLLFYLPTFALISAIMTAIGGMVTEFSQGQQIAGIINLPFMLPWFLSPMIFSDPNNPLLVAFSMIPLTSFLTIVMRWGLTVMPFWQLVVSWIMLVSTACLVMWISAKIFRLGMLSYGQRLGLHSLTQLLRSRRGAVSIENDRRE